MLIGNTIKETLIVSQIAAKASGSFNALQVDADGQHNLIDALLMQQKIAQSLVQGLNRIR